MKCHVLLVGVLSALMIGIPGDSLAAGMATDVTPRVESPALLETLEAQYVDVPRAVDGRPDEWPQPSRMGVTLSLDGTEVPGTHDLSVNASFAFDDQAFYVLVEAGDDRFEFPDRAWRYGDGFFLTFAEPTPTWASHRFITFGFSIEKERPKVYVVYRDGEGFPNLDVSDIQFEAASDVASHRIVYEASIPWDLLTPLRPLVDETWGLNLLYVDGDFGKRKVVCLYPDSSYDAEEVDVRITRPIRFVVGEVARTAVQFRPYRSHVLSGGTFPVGVGTLTPKPVPGAVVEWRIEASGSAEIDDGSLPAPMDRGAHSLRFEIPVGRLPCGPIEAQFTLSDASGEQLGRSSIPLLVFDVAELKGYRSALQELVGRNDVPQALKASSSTARYLLESVESYVANASPCQDIAQVRDDLQELKRAIGDLRAGRPVFAGRSGIFRHAHVSSIDGIPQPYSVAIPKDYDPEKDYPLLVMLHGSGVDERSFIRENAILARGLNGIAMAPKARGLSDWYQGDSGRDVFECLEDVRRRYAIDAERIFLYGFSMGGYGAWRLGLRRASLFAGVAILSAPLSHGGEDLTPLLEKVENVPLFVVHGTADTSIPIDEARRAVAILRKRNYPQLTYLEIEGAGHGGYGARFALHLGKWLQDRAPLCIDSHDR